MKKKTIYDEGIRFECQGSGKCCTSHGGFGYVYLTKEDLKRFAKHFQITVPQFKKQYCHKADGYDCLNDKPGTQDCVFLKNKQCSAYEGRPTQCRTWPFWPSNMAAKEWNENVKSFCPGVGKGRLYSKKEISEILKVQRIADQE